MEGGRCGPRRAADRRTHGSLGRRSRRSPDLRPQSPAAQPGRPLGSSAGDICERRDRKRDGAGEGRRRGPGRPGGGAYTVQQALEAGVLDEVQIHHIPVLLGAGRRLFDVLPSEIELEIVQVIDTPEATHIRYRIRR
ncbi:dihydrofolate reductase family protein [Nonomuraea aurantiaca]|uniref:dihydrofolate reductase family protein n=1 Tax=Nonomuraea aurantiaca TaxID=2878562 RepID=UPI001CD96C24|nr:dihydrofolate reductase family protein [Nonomuraea aurantiaca]MCA2229741.1 dihydrofolate reductase family protein [Nonomuraea aurantiaca]